MQLCSFWSLFHRTHFPRSTDTLQDQWNLNYQCLTSCPCQYSCKEWSPSCSPSCTLSLSPGFGRIRIRVHITCPGVDKIDERLIWSILYPLVHCGGCCIHAKHCNVVGWISGWCNLKYLRSECNSVSNRSKLHRFIACIALNSSAKLQLGQVSMRWLRLNSKVLYAQARLYTSINSRILSRIGLFWCAITRFV